MDTVPFILIKSIRIICGKSKYLSIMNNIQRLNVITQGFITDNGASSSEGQRLVSLCDLPVNRNPIYHQNINGPSIEHVSVKSRDIFQEKLFCL